jgi:hypothetical protein
MGTIQFFRSSSHGMVSKEASKVNGRRLICLLRYPKVIYVFCKIEGHLTSTGEVRGDVMGRMRSHDIYLSL